MSPDVRLQVDAEMTHAENALRGAEALLGLGIPDEAASRIYYAVFHAARALLFSIGIAPSSHEALRSLVGLHFVKAGRLPSVCAKDLAELEGLRLSGDYDPNFAITVEVLAPEVERARAFIVHAKRALTTAP